MLQTTLSIIIVIIEAVGTGEKTKEFTETGSEIYHGNLPEGAKEHH